MESGCQTLSLRPNRFTMSNLLRFATQSLQSLAPLFRPPFNGLGWLIVLYYGWCFLVYPHSQTLRGNLPDPDDYMYLTQTLDWLQGQGWYDNIQYRLNPPADGSLGGVPIHFSRLAQLAMAALIFFFEKMGLGPRASSMLTATVYPLVLLGGLLASMRWLAQSFVPKKWAGVTAYVTLFATGMMFMFMPGHVDHHNLVIILAVLTLACVMRMFDKPVEPLWGLSAGLLMALNLTIALEMLPWLLIIAGAVGLWSVIKGGKAAINTLAFGLALHIGSIFFLGITRPPTQWLVPDVLTYSVVYVFLTGGIAVCFAGLALAAKAPLALRLAIGSILATVTGYLFLRHFPDMIGGPYGGMDPELAQMMLGEIDEAQPLLHHQHSALDLTVYIGSVTFALIAGFTFFRRAKDNKEQWRWGLILVMLVTAFALTMFYQYRFMGMMSMLTIIPLTVLLQRGWTHIAGFKEGRKKVFAEIGLLLLVGPLPTVLYPALIDGRSFSTGILLFPVDSGITHAPCDTYQLEKILDDPKLYGDHPRLIMSSMGQGPELLFRTPHKVLAAPFHMDVSGNVDSTRFFSTPYASEAEAIARRRHIDLVVACRFVPEIFTRVPTNITATNLPNSAAADTPAVSTTFTPEHDFAPHFIELLMSNKQPVWLKPAHFPTLHNFVIFEMQPETLPSKAPSTR